MTLHASRSVPAALLSVASAALWSIALGAQAPTGPDPASPPRDPSARPATAVVGTAVVRGRVVSADTGLPLRRAKVSLRDAREPQGRSVTTDAAGAFAFEAVPKGRYRLRASKARYVDGALGGRRPGAPGRAFDVADGQKIDNLTIVLATAGVITGRVLDDGGEPMTGATVMALRQRTVNGVTRLAPSEHARPTDDTGAYRLFGLEPGRYYLSVRPDDERHTPDVDTSVTGLAPTYYPSTAVASEAQPIDVAAGAEAHRGHRGGGDAGDDGVRRGVRRGRTARDRRRGHAERWKRRDGWRFRDGGRASWRRVHAVGRRTGRLHDERASVLRRSGDDAD